MTMKDVLSPVTGTIWKIEKANGETIAVDQEIMIIESMKMEIGVQVEASGTVADIKVSEGETVDEGQVVAIIDVSN